MSAAVAERIPGLDITKKKKVHYKFFCDECNVSTLTYKAMRKHGFSKEHKEQEAKFKEESCVKVTDLLWEAHNVATEEEKAGKDIDLCEECLLQYTGSREDHEASIGHKEMIKEVQVHCEPCKTFFNNSTAFRKHKMKLQHFINDAREKADKENLIYDMVQNEFNDEIECGIQCSVDKQMYACKACNITFEPEEDGQDTFKSHCKSLEHYNNFKALCEKSKEEGKELKEPEDKETKPDPKVNESMETDKAEETPAAKPATPKETPKQTPNETPKQTTPSAGVKRAAPRGGGSARKRGRGKKQFR